MSQLIFSPVPWVWQTLNQLLLLLLFHSKSSFFSLLFTESLSLKGFFLIGFYLIRQVCPTKMFPLNPQHSPTSILPLLLSSAPHRYLHQRSSSSFCSCLPQSHQSAFHFCCSTNVASQKPSMTSVAEFNSHFQPTSCLTHQKHLTVPPSS